MKTYIYISLISILVGIGGGILIDKFLLPKKESPKIEQYQVTNECENDKKEEEKVIEDPCPLAIDIGGAVLKPGLYCLPKESTVNDALKKAGGLSKNIAAVNYINREINLARLLSDNEKIYFPKKTETSCKLQDFNSYLVTTEKETKEITQQESAKKEENTSQCLNINNSSQEQLETLNGVGASTAKKIINGRPYSKIEDLLKVSGIGQATFDKFKGNICI